MNSSKILLVEDESDILELIKIQLEAKGYYVKASMNGNEAIDLIQSEEFNLFVIDRMIPGASGLDVCKFIRRYRSTKKHPILIVTALSRSENVIEGLEAGADDYITKPFDMQVLIARTNALLRRYQFMKEFSQDGDNNITFGKMRMDLDQCKVWYEEDDISLTASEYKILYLMVKNSRKVMTRRELVGFVQGESIHVTERTIDTHISGLRKKLGKGAQVIETIRGIGYRVSENEI